MSETTDDAPLFPVRMTYHNNRYAAVLYDVDGNVLTGESGMTLNVFREEFKDMLSTKKIRFLHYLEKEPTYAYFITSPHQWERFLVERVDGSTSPTRTYHVYTD